MTFIQGKIFFDMLSNKVVKIKTCIYQKDFITLEMWMDPRGKYKEGLRLRTI